jgi:hypothetical protein
MLLSLSSKWAKKEENPKLTPDLIMKHGNQTKIFTKEDTILRRHAAHTTKLKALTEEMYCTRADGHQSRTEGSVKETRVSKGELLGELKLLI